MQRNIILGLSGIALLLAFQNCSASFSSPGNSEKQSLNPSGIPTAMPEATPVPDALPSPVNKSALVFEHYEDISTPNCFAGGPNVIQKVFVYKRIFVPELGRTVSLRAYVHRTEGSAANKPGIAMFHGGGWGDGAPTFWFGPAFYFASRGAVTVSFQYRLNKFHRTGVAEAVADARSAMRWLRSNAESLGIDAQNIAAMGDSAGGHLALSTALIDRVNDEEGVPAKVSTLPSAIAVVYPVVETVIPGVIDLPLLSPTKLFKQNLPTTLILAGTADSQPLTPIGRTRDFCELTGCTLKEYVGREHSFLSQEIGNVQDAHSYKEAVADFDEFFEAAGLIPADGTPARTRLANSAPACREHNNIIANQRAIDYGYDQANYTNF